MRYKAWDTETTLSDMYNPVPDLVCYSDYDGSGDANLYNRKEALEVFERDIRDENLIMVGHFSPFDLRVMLKASPKLWPYVEKALNDGRIRDTLIRDKLIRISQGTLKFAKDFKLDTIAQRLLKINPMDKGEDSWRLRYGELIDVPVSQWPERASRYAKDDAIVTFRVYMAQKGGRKVSPCEDLQNRKAFVLHDMQMTGLKVDREWRWKYREANRVLEDMLVDILLENKILKRNKGKVSADLKKVKDLIQQGYESLGLDVPRGELTKIMKNKGQTEGNIKTDVETILALQERPKITAKDYVGSVVESYNFYKKNVLQAFVRYKNINSKIISTYLDNMDFDIIRPRFNPLVDTGRMSCSKPNLQNVPREPGIRECIMPHDPGNLICSVDFNSMELRTFAQSMYSMFGKSRMKDIYCDNPDADPHGIMAAEEFLGIPYSEFDKHNKEHKAARNMSKIGHFGGLGGLGPTTLRKFAKAGYGMDLTHEEAKLILDNLKKMYPEVPIFFSYISAATRDKVTGESSYADFELPVSGRKRGKCTFTAGANFFFQGPGGDVIAEALWYVYCATKNPRSVLFRCKIINVIHDEILVEVPPGIRGSECAKEIERLMIEGGQKWNPDVPLRAEAALCDVWRKNMENKTDEDGNIIADIPETDWRDGWTVEDLKKALGHNLDNMQCHPLANTIFGDLRNVDFSQIGA